MSANPNSLPLELGTGEPSFVRFLELLLTNPLMFLSEAQEHCRAINLVAIPLSADGALGYVAWFLKNLETLERLAQTCALTSMMETILFSEPVGKIMLPFSVGFCGYSG